MLIDARRYACPELDVFHESIDVRVPALRVSVYRGRNVATDYGLLERATPFVHRLRRPQLTLLLSGVGRFEEGGRRAWVRGGEFIACDPCRGSTEAYAGAACEWLCVTWDPAALGMPLDGAFVVGTLAYRDHARLRDAAARLGDEPAAAMTEMLAVLRAVGLSFVRLDARDLGTRLVDGRLTMLQAAVGGTLSRLERHPDIEDVAASLGWSKRLVHRRMAKMAEEYSLAWAHWREALHQARLLQALRLLSAPGATTELVARLTGFRAPAALCHAFAKATLPSPGSLAQAARREVLESWSHFLPAAGVDVLKGQSTRRSA